MHALWNKVVVIKVQIDRLCLAIAFEEAGKGLIKSKSYPGKKKWVFGKVVVVVEDRGLGIVSVLVEKRFVPQSFTTIISSETNLI